jgi:hypothetical protein
MTGMLLQLPIWLFGLLVLGVLLLIGLAGYAVRQWHDARHRQPPEEKEGGQEGYLVSAVLGLFALLLGFTFALAVDRFDARRMLVLEEANAIGTTYLRAQLLEAPHRARISGLLVAYADNRIALGKATELDAGAREMLATNDRLVTELWQATAAAFPSIRDFDFSSSFIDSVNTVIELDAKRKTARRARVPPGVFAVLGIYGAGVALVLGYVLTGWRGRIAGVFLLALFTLSVMLIMDIDLPTSGRINESQEPIEQLRASLSGWRPAVFDSLP